MLPKPEPTFPELGARVAEAALKLRDAEELYRVTLFSSHGEDRVVISIRKDLERARGKLYRLLQTYEDHPERPRPPAPKQDA